ncbi:MAG: ABC transporter permease [Solirubrobacteraceae bacterium]
MAVASDTRESGPSSPGPAPRRARGAEGLSLVKQFLTLREGSIIVVTAITVIYFAVTTPVFFTGANFRNVLPYFCFLAIMGAGQVFVMTLGEIDLSIGALYLITPFIYWKFTEAGLPLVPSLVLSLVVAGIIGAFNGFFTAYIGIASFVVTLAMLFFLDGLALILSHSEQITTPGTSVTKVGTFAQIFGGGTYSELIWALGIVAVLQVVLSFSRSGLYTVATGGNRIAAAEAGINTRMIVLRNFVLCAVTAGFAGVLEGVRTSSITPDPSGSNQFLLYAIAGVIIGGTAMTGGEGTVVGALIGAFFIGTLEDGLTVKSVPATYEFLWLGIAILIAMTINRLVRRVRLGSGRA